MFSVPLFEALAGSRSLANARRSSSLTRGRRVGGGKIMPRVGRERREDGGARASASKFDLIYTYDGTSRPRGESQVINRYNRIWFLVP